MGLRKQVKIKRGRKRERWEIRFSVFVSEKDNFEVINERKAVPSMMMMIFILFLPERRNRTEQEEEERNWEDEIKHWL